MAPGCPLRVPKENLPEGSRPDYPSLVRPWSLGHVLIPDTASHRAPTEYLLAGGWNAEMNEMARSLPLADFLTSSATGRLQGAGRSGGDRQGCPSQVAGEGLHAQLR